MAGRVKTLQELLLETMSFEDIVIHVLQSKEKHDEFDSASLELFNFALRCRKFDIVDRVLKFTNLLNKLKKESLTILHYAPSLGCAEIVEGITKLGDDINVQSAKKNTALHFATKRGRSKAVHIQNEKRLSALMVATGIKANNCLHALFKVGSDINVKDRLGYTALHYACLFIDTVKVKILLEVDADVNITNEVSALHVLLPDIFYIRPHCGKRNSSQNVNDIAELLVHGGINVTLKDKQGNTALHQATMMSDNLELLETLIQAGADVNAQNCQGETALHFSSMRHEDGQIRLLKEKGADFNIQSNNGATALHFAIWSGSDESEDITSEQLLIDSNINVMLKDQNGNTALHQAAMSLSNNKVIEKLIKAGIKVNEPNNAGETALHYACTTKYGLRLIRVLKENEADINTESKSGDTGLHYAVRNGSKEIVKELLESGAEINKQNNFGETALHNSFWKRDFEVIEFLLMNRALTSIKDNEGHDPLWCLFNLFNTETPLSMVFKLQHYLRSYRDICGNTIFHQFLQKDYAVSSKETWSLIHSNKEHFITYLPVQNIFGQTILHIAAENSTNHNFLLKNIFSIFDLSLQDELLHCDENGNTFLHIYFSQNLSSTGDISFLQRLFESEYQSCSYEVRKKLLESENSVGNTPLHLLFCEEFMHHEAAELDNFLEMLIDTGELNSQNRLGENVVHRLMLSYRSLPILTRRSLAKGSDINVQNIFGESEVFIVPSSENHLTSDDFLTLLAVSGFDFRVCNRIGQTMIMSNLKELCFNLSLFTNAKDLINKQDKLKSNLLHYIAWEERIETTFLENPEPHIISNLSVHEDKLNQLPCDIACSRGHVNILQQICVCKNGVHKKEPVFYRRRLIINSLTQNKKSFKNCVLRISEFCSEGTIENIINEPFIGLVRFENVNNEINIDKIDKEAAKVKKVIVNFVERLCKKLFEKDKSFRNKVILSGSVYEGTKVGLPDEYDFICLFDKMSNMLEIKENSVNGLNVNLRGMFREELCGRFFDSKGKCLLNLIDRFYTIIYDILQEPDMYSHPNLFRVRNGFKRPKNGPNFRLKLRWSHCRYKNMIIKIDIVPAFEIHFSKFYFDNFNPTNNNVMMMIKFDELTKETSWSVSASMEEKQHLSSFSPEAKEAYVISKILCSERVCPRIIRSFSIFDYDRMNSYCYEIISSYMLKNCLFYVARDTKKSDFLMSVHGYVCKIFEKLLYFASQKTFPCFMFPDTDLFEYHDKGKSSYECTIREMYAKFILIMLGKIYDFDDIKVNQLYIENGNMYDEVDISFIKDTDICANCKKNPKKDGVILTPCSRCKLWTYCSDECKQLNLSRHKPACDYHYEKLQSTFS